jgi:hypothetical protein
MAVTSASAPSWTRPREKLLPSYRQVAFAADPAPENFT